MTPERQTLTAARTPWLARAAAGAALIAGLVLVLVVLFGNGNGRTYHLLFENGGQLVSGNEVLRAGQKIGSVKDVTLTDDSQAEVTISVDEPLHEGTSATIRATSLSGIANRYVSITPGPDNTTELDDGATLSGEKTTSPVDLDQIFNTLRPRTQKALRNVIQGSASLYANHAEGAQRTYKYFAPGLSTSRRLFAEVNFDSRSLSQFLVQGSRALGAIADRRDDLSALTQNANEFLGAIAQEQTALDTSLQAFPPALRQANTTFVNVRAFLDDLTPLVNEFKPATKDLAPFLRKLRPVAERSIPVFHDLRLTVNRSGPTNDLTDSLQELPKIENKASSSVPRTIAGLDASQPTIEFARPYMPDLMGFLSKFAEVTSFYDANGHYARVSTAQANLFHYCKSGDTNSHCTGGGGPYTTGQLAPIPPSEQFNDLEFDIFTRCPGGATQPISGSNPFTDDGSLLSGGQSPNPKCDPSDVPPG
ncbi:MAG TPA: MlaD family protein [Solirubrobacterales bacterium]|nr:MlaD family protein [Solirubrobacterales bacterium]